MNPPIHIDGKGFFSALALLATGMAEDGKLSAEEIAEGIDEMVDTGMFDDYDDPFILGFVEYTAPLAGKTVDAIRGILDRDPDKIRERADIVEIDGNEAKAERMRARADRIEARQAARG